MITCIGIAPDTPQEWHALPLDVLYEPWLYPEEITRFVRAALPDLPI